MKALRTLVVLVMATACSPKIEPADSIPPQNGHPDTITGVVRVVGSAPVTRQVVMETSDGRQTRLVGELRDELARLAGLEVSVSGSSRPTSDPLAAVEIDVASYQIGMVDGRRVILGEVVQISGQDAQLRTADGDIIFLSGIPTEFRVGQKVWVQGPSTVVVQSFGVLRQ